MIKQQKILLSALITNIVLFVAQIGLGIMHLFLNLDKIKQSPVDLALTITDVAVVSMFCFFAIIITGIAIGKMTKNIYLNSIISGVMTLCIVLYQFVNFLIEFAWYNLIIFAVAVILGTTIINLSLKLQKQFPLRRLGKVDFS